MKTLLLPLAACLLLAAPLTTLAQAPAGVTIGAATAADPSAALDIVSSDKGVLLPRITEAARLAMGTGSVPAPAAGLIVFQTDGAQPGFWYAGSPTTWVRLSDGATANTQFLQNQAVVDQDASFRISGSGYVGGALVVGTTAPMARLHVEATGGHPVLLGGGATTGAEIKLLRTGTSHVSLYNNSGALTIANTSTLAQTNTAGFHLMTIGGSSSGSPGSNVGIGTSVPTERLDVNGNINVTGTLKVNTADVDKIHLTTQGSNGSKIGHAVGWGILNYAGPGTSGSNVGFHRWLTSTPNGYVGQMQLNSAGFLSVGHDQPLGRFHVVNDAGGGGAADDYLIDEYGTGDQTLFFRKANGTRATPAPLASGDFIGRISFVPGVGSGALSYAAAAEIQATYRGDGGNRLGDLLFRTSLVERMRINENGNVGIGTTAPDEKLDVVGNVQVPAANAFTYAAPKAYQQVVAMADFRPETPSSSLTLLDAGASELAYSASGAGVFRAPLRLPQGAQLTGFTVYYGDNVAANLTVSVRALTAASPSTTAILGSFTSAGTFNAYQSATTALSATVSNSSSYYVRVELPVSHQHLSVSAVRVSYTITQVE